MHEKPEVDMGLHLERLQRCVDQFWEDQVRMLSSFFSSSLSEAAFGTYTYAPTANSKPSPTSLWPASSG